VREYRKGGKGEREERDVKGILPSQSFIKVSAYVV